MTRYRFGFFSARTAAAVATAVALVSTGACFLGTSPDNKPSSAVVDIQGSTPNPLLLVLSSDFVEQLNTGTGEYTATLRSSDTTFITPPYHQAVDISATGNIYVELYQPEVAEATVTMKVDIDNGQGYDRSATLADKAKLVYYFTFTNYTF